MCGIAGKLYFNPSDVVSRPEIEAMLQVMRHRGPDARGIHLDGPLGLGHCRLSIIDLTTGSQPMGNEDGTVWVVFNGEIYNFEALRAELETRGHHFASRADTEVIVHLYEEMGPACVTRLRGMFAFALWDANTRRLVLARDRVGIKPLYYSLQNDAIRFGSELKAIITDAAVHRSISANALRLFHSFHYIPGEETLFGGIKKLLPGHSLVVENGKTTISQNWDLRFTRDRFGLSLNEAADELNTLLAARVEDHMIADVPVGVLLSGGVDSSAILSFAARGKERVRTFTVGFDGKEVVDERPYARAAAERYGTEHREITITAEDFWNFLPAYVWHMEEPVCEPPAVALYFVSKLARAHVKVLLSGEGGDEAFAGYPNYPNMLKLQRVQSLLGPFQHIAGYCAARVGNMIGEPRVERYGTALGRPLHSQYFSRTSGPTGFFTRHAEHFFSSEFQRESATVSAPQVIEQLVRGTRGECLLNQMLYIDTKSWLPDDLLVKADKMTMANSVELRVPFLDHQVLEFAASLPPEHKVRGAETKRVLRVAFSKLLPETVLRRKKAGFPVPYEKWLRDELRPQVEALLLSDRALSRNYYRPDAVRSLLAANARTGSYGKEVFCLLVTELWHQTFLDSAVPRPELETAQS